MRGIKLECAAYCRFHRAFAANSPELADSIAAQSIWSFAIMVRPMFRPLRDCFTNRGREHHMQGGKSFSRFSVPTSCRVTPTPDICTGLGLFAGG
nr:hypothetical protein [uncultured Roseateles sp.]